MAESLTLQAQIRKETGRNAMHKLRASSIIPAVLYGKEKESQHIALSIQDFDKVYAAAGESTLIDLAIDGGDTTKVLIHGVQFDPVKDIVTHADFYIVNMSETIQTEVELVYEGVAPAVKELGGTLLKNLDHIVIECLPVNLPHHLIIDVSALKTFDDMIRIKDVAMPAGVTPIDDIELTLALVTPPRTDAEMEELSEDIVENVENVEVDGAKEKDADEDQADGKEEKKKEKNQKE